MRQRVIRCVSLDTLQLARQIARAYPLASERVCLAACRQRIPGMKCTQHEKEFEVTVSRQVPAVATVILLHAGLRHSERMAGLLALSNYLPFPDTLTGEKSAADAGAPIAMFHGRMGPIVPIGMGLEARHAQRTGRPGRVARASDAAPGMRRGTRRGGEMD
jgi:hypothetical protein